LPCLVEFSKSLKSEVEDGEKWQFGVTNATTNFVCGARYLQPQASVKKIIPPMSSKIQRMSPRFRSTLGPTTALRRLCALSKLKSLRLLDPRPIVGMLDRPFSALTCPAANAVDSVNMDLGKGSSASWSGGNSPMEGRPARFASP